MKFCLKPKLNSILQLLLNVFEVKPINMLLKQFKGQFPKLSKVTMCWEICQMKLLNSENYFVFSLQFCMILTEFSTKIDIVSIFSLSIVEMWKECVRFLFFRFFKQRKTTKIKTRLNRLKLCTVKHWCEINQKRREKRCPHSVCWTNAKCMNFLNWTKNLFVAHLQPRMHLHWLTHTISNANIHVHMHLYTAYASKARI